MKSKNQSKITEAQTQNEPKTYNKIKSLLFRNTSVVKMYIHSK